jgi:hypothetical protein
MLLAVTIFIPVLHWLTLRLSVIVGAALNRPTFWKADRMESVRRTALATVTAASLLGSAGDALATPNSVSAAEDAARVAAWWHRKEPPHWHYTRHHQVPQKPVPVCYLGQALLGSCR